MGLRSVLSHRLAVAWAWTLAVAALLLVRVPIPLAEAERRLFGVLPVDKVVHLALFGLLVALWRRWVQSERSGAVALVVAVVVAAILYGGALELLQPFFARDAEWGDLVADAAGALLAGLAPGRWFEL